MPYIFKKPYKRRPNTQRIKRQEIYQSGLWKKMRLAHLREHPLCEVCLLMGKTTLAEHVHHLRSFMEAKDDMEKERLAYDENNLCSVCHVCHNRIHNGDLKGTKSKEDIKQKLVELGLIPISL